MEMVKLTSGPPSGIGPGTAVAVTGATGFIGGRLVEQLGAAGADITCLIHGDALTSARLHRAGARNCMLDLTDADAVTTALRGIAIVFHLAYDSEDTAWNFAAMRSLIKACDADGCQRLVHVSSFVVYDLPAKGAVSEETPRSTAAEGYAHTKLALEDELLQAVRERDLPATIIQPTIVYGPFSRSWTNDPADMLRHGTVVLPDAGEGLCNAVYVDDVVSAMLLAAVQPKAVGQRYLVSGPEPITWSRFYEGMACAIGISGPRYQPASAILQANGKAAKLRRLVADPERVVRQVVARIGPASKLMQKLLRVLPKASGQDVHARLFGPITQRRGHVHFPNPGHLGFLQGRTAIGSGKARNQLGYMPAFDFDMGMEPTGRYLRGR